MKNLLKISILPIVAITMLLGFASSALAIDTVQPLVVQFVPNPLFDKPDFLPGDLSSGQVTVTNGSGASQIVQTEAINIFDSDNFGSLLHLTIVGSGETFFDDSLAHFFANAGEVPLGALPSGQSAVFTYTISFIDSNDDSYQGKTLGFDVCVGFRGGNTHCGNTAVGDDTSIVGPGGSGVTVSGLGGGGGGGSTSLLIFHEQALNISNVNQSGSAAITWDTNKLSTSQVVYGPVSGGPYTLDLTALNFGYPFGSLDDPTKVVGHAIQLTGLTPGQAYVYRVVSRASPPTVSYEHQFIVPLLAEAGGSGFTGGNPYTGYTGNDGSGTGEISGTSSASAEATLGSAPSTDEGGTGPNGNLAGAAASGFGYIFTSWIFWIILILLILLVVYLIWRSGRRDDQRG